MKTSDCPLCQKQAELFKTTYAKVKVCLDCVNDLYDNRWFFAEMLRGIAIIPIAQVPIVMSHPLTTDYASAVTLVEGLVRHELAIACPWTQVAYNQRARRRFIQRF